MTKLNQLEITVRAFNALNIAGIKTLEELEFMSGTDLLKLKNFGRKSLIELRACLGLEFLETKDYKEKVSKFNALHVGIHQVVWKKSTNETLSVQQFAEDSIVPALSALLWMKTKKFWRITINFEEL